jgi:hypothetical protein
MCGRYRQVPGEVGREGREEVLFEFRRGSCGRTGLSGPGQ